MQTRIVDCPMHKHVNPKVAYEFFDTKNCIDPVIRCPTEYHTKKEMLASVYAEIVSKYLMLNGRISKRKERCTKTFFQFYVQLYTNKSQILIRPPTQHKNEYQEDVVFPSPLIKEIVKASSQRLMYKLTGIKDYVPGSLAHRAYIVYSYYHLIYEKFSPCMDFDGQFFGQTYDRVVFTTGHMTLEKQIHLLKEYDVDTCFEGEKWNKVSRLIGPAYRILLDYLNLKKYFDTIEFKYSPEDLFFWNWNTGGGIIPGSAYDFVVEGIKYKMHNSGKKSMLYEANLRAFHKFMIHLYFQKNVDYVDFEVIRQKKEWKKLMGTPTIEKLKKLLLSMREFFIPSMFHSFMGHTLLWFLKYIMTGTYIAIGINFMHGGAYNLAKLLSYDVPGQRYGKGDIYKLDKHVQSIFMDMYCGTGYLCYKMSNKTERAKNYIKNLFRYFMYHIVTKIVLHLGGFWRIEKGKVYSGGLETSLLDSFAKLFLFCIYLQYNIWKYPSIAPYIKQCIYLRILAMIVYGDDHAWTWPDTLQQIINTKTYAWFLDEFFDMKLREVEEFDSFLSVIDEKTQEVKKSGIIFLKRRFIETTIPDMPPVIAHKETREIMTSLCLKEFFLVTGEEVDVIDMLLSCIGQAYDAQLNIVAYQAVKEIYYDILARYTVINPEKEIQDYIKRPDKRLKISKILRRTGLTSTEILNSFPTWNQVLERGKLDNEKCQFGQRASLNLYDYSVMMSTFDNYF